MQKAQVDTMADNKSDLQIADLSVNHPHLFSTTKSKTQAQRILSKYRKFLMDNWEFCYSRKTLKRERSGKFVKFISFLISDS